MCTKLIPYGEEPEGYWRTVPGAENYQASVDGQVRRLYKSGYRIQKSYKSKQRTKNKAWFIKVNGKEKAVNRVVYTAFYGPIPDGMRIMHRDGISSNHAPYNLVCVSMHELGKRTGKRATSRCVLKYDPATMECVASYPSARACARDNNMSYQTIMDRCNGKTKKSIAPDGYDYCWDDDQCSLRWMRKRIKTHEARKK